MCGSKSKSAFFGVCDFELHTLFYFFGGDFLKQILAALILVPVCIFILFVAFEKIFREINIGIVLLLVAIIAIFSYTIFKNSSK